MVISLFSGMIFLELTHDRNALGVKREAKQITPSELTVLVHFRPAKNSVSMMLRQRLAETRTED